MEQVVSHDRCPVLIRNSINRILTPSEQTQCKHVYGIQDLFDHSKTRSSVQVEFLAAKTARQTLTRSQQVNALQATMSTLSQSLNRVTAPAPIASGSQPLTEARSRRRCLPQSRHCCVSAGRTQRRCGEHDHHITAPTH